MAARAIGSGTIGFGLVSIPVKLYPSVSASSAISFNNLHKDCGTRVKMQYMCPKDDVVLARDDMVKGYEFAKNRYVTFTPDELKAVEAQGGGDIGIEEFVPLAAVDPIYYDKSYYLGPDKGGGRAYALLAAALRETGYCAVSRYAARGKQYLALVRPSGEGLVLQQLHYADQVRDMKDVGLPDADVKDSELTLAIQLIEQGAKQTFEPGKYHDEVKARVEALIERKVSGEDITESQVPEQPAQVIDIMAALKQSLGMTSEQAAAGAEQDAPKQRKGPKRAAQGKGASKKRSSRKKTGG